MADQQRERTDRDVFLDAAERLGRRAQEMKDRYDLQAYPIINGPAANRLFERYTRLHRLSTELLEAAKEHQ